jgi:putative transposase
MGLFKDLYRIPSARLQNWDYRRGAWYFVTICTRKHVCSFGQVVEGEVVLSPAGKIVAEEWQHTPVLRPSVSLDEWQVMPNHLHGILVIENTDRPPVETARWAVSRGAVSKPETFQRNVSTAKGGLRAGSLGSIVGQFKSVCTKRIWTAGARDFRWQTRFYDRIVRNQGELERIREYIHTNALRWACDRYNPERSVLVQDGTGHALPWEEM